MDEVVSFTSSSSHAWLGQGSLLTSIYANLGEQWTKVNRRNYQYALRSQRTSPFVGDPEIIPAHPKESFPRCPITTFLLSWPDRIRTRDESRRLFLALLSNRPDPEFLHLVTYTAHQGWYSEQLVVTWPLIVEYWRRRYPKGFEVRPRQARMLLYDEDCRRLGLYWNLRLGVRECLVDIRRWLVDVVQRPRLHPFRPPHWASPELCALLQSVVPDIPTFEPEAATIDQVEINIARILAVCRCYQFRTPPQRDQYAAVYQQFVVCIHKFFQTMAWYNFTVNQS